MDFFQVVQYVLPQQVQLLFNSVHVLAQLALLRHALAQQIDTLCNQFPALRQLVFGRLVQLFKQLAEQWVMQYLGGTVGRFHACIVQGRF